MPIENPISAKAAATIKNKTLEHKREVKGYAVALLKFFKDAANNGVYHKVVNNRIVPKRPPTIEMFATSIGKTSRCLRAWASEKDLNGKLKYPEFAEAYEICMDIKHDFVFVNSLMGGYTSEIAKLELKNKHGYKEHAFDADAGALPVVDVNFKII